MKLKCKFCSNKAPKNMRGYCQSCYRYFVIEGKDIYPLPPYGVMTTTDDGDIICPLCGKAFSKLGAHLFNGHHMLAQDVYVLVGWDKDPKATNEKYKEHMRSVLQPKCVTINLTEKGKSTRFKSGSKGRTKEQMSEMTRLKIIERNKRNA